MEIKKFVPPKILKKNLDLNRLNDITQKKWQYATTGKSALFQILKKFKNKKILIPSYICHSVLVPIEELNMIPIYYDIDTDDLNASIDSVKHLFASCDVNIMLIASMYGNPADYSFFEEYCENNSIYLIDDGAQSFGAKVDERYVGTFGNAGFFSFSPGKPTAGHLGAFFWSDDEIHIERTSHELLHRFKWYDFYLNRYCAYAQYNIIFKWSVNMMARILYKSTSYHNDGISQFEQDILGGIIDGVLTDQYSYRRVQHDKYYELFKDISIFKIIIGLRGRPNNHKLILLFFDIDEAVKFRKFLASNNIYCSSGYNLHIPHSRSLEKLKYITGRIVEIPIENSAERMNYLGAVTKHYLSGVSSD